jgi:hypothetical protein
MCLWGVRFGRRCLRRVLIGLNMGRSVSISCYNVYLLSAHGDYLIAYLDIFEAVNNENTNQIALHTTAGCTATPINDQTGKAGPTDCDQNMNSGSGCTVRDVNEKSAGEGFNAAGGGVYVAAFEVRFRPPLNPLGETLIGVRLQTSGINIWFFSRDAIPQSLGASTGSIDVTTLGTPSASYSGSSCDIEKYFGSQQLTLDITVRSPYFSPPRSPVDYRSWRLDSSAETLQAVLPSSRRLVRRLWRRKHVTRPMSSIRETMIGHS